jgi:hypothetical protein
MATCAFPSIDPNVKHVGVSKLRDLNATKLKEQTNETLVIQDNDTPIAVLFSYKKFLEIQEEFKAAINMIELLSDEKEHKGLLAAFEDIVAGRVRSLDEIESEMQLEK